MPSGTMLAHVEVPKVALFRTLVCLIAMVWLAEWMVRPGPGWRSAGGWGLRRLRLWLGQSPSNWVVLAFGLYLAVNVAATATSASPAVSLWGKRPGGDGYGLYNLLCLTVLFLAVYTHLRRPAQVWRLMAAIVLTGVVVGGYSIAQHLGLDPLLEAGATVKRTYSTLGNPIFAGAVLLMTTTMTLTLGFIAQIKSRSRWPFVAAWAALVVQLVGIWYTLGRGSWIGLAFGACLFLVLIWVVCDARRAGAFALASFLALIVSVAIVFGLDGLVASRAGTGPTPEAVSKQALLERALSIYPEIAGGGISDRQEIWSGAIQLIRERPWSDFEPMPLPWARQLLGYGPEIFRFVFPLRSPPRANAQVAFQAHNVPLHVGVEVGILGLLSMTAVAAAILAAGFVQLFINRYGQPLTQRVILAGVLATLVGRGVEMMGGIPRMGDLTIFVLLLAVFAGISRVRLSSVVACPTHVEELPSPTAHCASRLEWAWMIGRFSLVFVAIVALGVLTWLKAVNYARADAVAAQGLSSFADGESWQGIEHMLKAASMAPDVVDYPLLVARMFDTLADSATTDDARLRWARGAYFFSGEAVDANGLDPGARAVMANAAISLGLLREEGRFQEAISLSETVMAMMPNFAVSHYAAALPHLLGGDVDEGLRHIDAGDALFDPTDHPSIAAEGAFLRGLGHRLGEDNVAAVDAFNRSLELDASGRYASTAHQHLAELYEALGDYAKADQHRDSAR